MVGMEGRGIAREDRTKNDTGGRELEANTDSAGAKTPAGIAGKVGTN